MNELTESINFATSYRPTTFAEVVGQEIPKQVLKKLALAPGISARAVFLKGSYGSGKCVPAGTRVLTSQGYLPIEFLYPNPKEGFNDFVTEVHTRFGIRTSDKFYYQKQAEVLNLTLSNGYTLRGTPEHRVMVHKDGNSDLIKLGSLSLGDSIMLSNDIQEFGIDDERAWLLGAILGGVKHNHFYGTEEMCNRVVRELGLLDSPVKDENSSSYIISIHESDILKLSCSYDELPSWAFNLSVPSRWNLLKGFLDTSSDEFNITSKSQKLIFQLYELLQTLGCIGTLSIEVKEQPHYILRIPSIEFNSFLNDTCLSQNYIELSSSELLELKSLKERVDPTGIRSQILLDDFNLHKRATSNSLLELKQIFNCLPSSLSEAVKYSHVKITSIYSSVEDVYDLSVPSVHEFYAQGTYNHNTTLARIFARAMNCEHFKQNGDVCNECSSCKEVLAKNSQLYLEFDSSVVGNVDAIRSLQEQLSYIPNGRRVVVFDEVHACLDCKTSLLTTKGPIEIGDLVKSNDDFIVDSVNYETGEVQQKRVLSKFDNGQDFNTIWFNILWNGGSARVTENHPFFKNGIKVYAKDLVSGDKLDSVQWVLSSEAEQVLIGTLLGSSIISRPAYLQMSSAVEQLDYLEWKSSFFSSLKWKETSTNRIHKHLFKIWNLENYSHLFSNRNTHKTLTRETLDKMGPLAWLCWYIDKGQYKNGFITIPCSNLGLEGANLVKEYCFNKFGWNIHISSSLNTRTNKLSLKLLWNTSSTIEFFNYVKGLIDVDCINHKLPSEYRGTILPKLPKRELVKESLEVQVSEVKKEEWDCVKESDRFRRFNIEVESNHNYTLPGGLLTSNCSRAALNAMLKMIEEGIPNTMFVFASTEDILPTIKSRSICLDITPIPSSLMKERLSLISKSQNIIISDSALDQICVKSAGHMRDALSLLQLYSLVGDDGLKSSYNSIVKFFMSAVSGKVDVAQSLLVDILKYNIVDIKNSLYLFIRNCFVATPDSKLYPFIKSGLINKIFSFIFNPVQQSALSDEVGIEIVFRSFLSKIQK